MAIFWRTHKVSVKKSKGKAQRRDLVDRDAWETEFSFQEAHRRQSLLARRASAAYILYQARLGYIQSTSPQPNTNRRRYRPLGNGTVLDAVGWIHPRFRLQFTQIIHFALATLTARLCLRDIPKPIRVDRLKAWLVKDFESFAGKTLASCLKRWLNEVQVRFGKGERVIRSFGLPTPPNYEPCLDPDLRYRPLDFLPGDSCLFTHVAGFFDDWDGEYDIGGEDRDAELF